MEEQLAIPELLIKLGKDAVMPSKANDSDTGYDLTATSIIYNTDYGFLEYGTGIFMNIPKGYEVKVYARSSISKYDLFLCNSVAVIDESYTNEILIRMKVTVDYEFAQWLPAHQNLKCSREGINTPFYPTTYKIGDKLAQFEMCKKDVYVLKEAQKIQETDRGGFGSTTAIKQAVNVIGIANAMFGQEGKNNMLNQWHNDERYYTNK